MRVLNLKPVHIITTNFDLLIEKSLEEKHIYGSTVYGSWGNIRLLEMMMTLLMPRKITT